METTQIILSNETIEALRPFITQTAFDKWLPVLAAILGAAIGGLISYIPNLCLEKKRRAMEVEAVKNSLTTEIRGIIDIAEKRRYFIELQKMIPELERSKGKVKFWIKIPEHYSRVYQSQVSRIGLLPSDLASKIIEFHALIDSIVQDVIPGGLIDREGADVEVLKTLRDFYGHALAIAKDIENY